MSDVDKCAIAATFAEDMWLSGAHVFQLLLCLAVLVLAHYYLLTNKSRKVAMHANLKIILANVVVLYVLMCSPVIFMVVRYQLVLYRFYSNPCDLLSPPWVSIVVRGPYFAYFVAFPLWHLAISIERSWATFRVNDYEDVSHRYSIVASVLVWTASIFYVVYVVWLASQDPLFSSGSVYVSLTTNTSAQLLLDTHYYLLALDIFTCAVDCTLVFVNRRHMKKATASYSLSRSYQVNENVIVTLRLIMSMSVCNTVVYVVFMALSTWGRTLRSSLPPHRFFALYEWIFTVLLMQLVIPLLILIRFTKTAKQSAVVHAQSEHKNLYFEHFRQQIGVAKTATELID